MIADLWMGPIGMAVGCWVAHGNPARLLRRTNTFEFEFCQNSTRLYWWIHRAVSSFAPSQWKTLSQTNAVSHWLGANLVSALNSYHKRHIQEISTISWTDIDWSPARSGGILPGTISWEMPLWLISICDSNVKISYIVLPPRLLEAMIEGNLMLVLVCFGAFSAGNITVTS